MRDKLHPSLCRTRLILKITAVLLISSLLLMVGVQQFTSDSMESTEVTVTQDFDSESSTTTVTLTWNTQGRFEQIELYKLYSEPDEFVKVDRTGQQASISGLSEGDKLAVLGYRPDAEELIRYYTVKPTDEIVVSDVRLAQTDNNQSSTLATNVTWTERSSIDKVYAVKPDDTTTRGIYDSGKTITISDVEQGEKIKVVGHVEDRSPTVLQTHTVGDGVTDIHRSNG